MPEDVFKRFEREFYFNALNELSNVGWEGEEVSPPIGVCHELSINSLRKVLEDLKDLKLDVNRICMSKPDFEYLCKVYKDDLEFDLKRDLRMRGVKAKLDGVDIYSMEGIYQHNIYILFSHVLPHEANMWMSMGGVVRLQVLPGIVTDL